MKKVPRNEYFDLVGKLGVKKTEEMYDIADLDLSKYKLREVTQRIANINFMVETKNPDGNYMLAGHWLSDLSYQFAKKCGFVLVQVDSYSSYGYSDEQLAIFTYCEGDITLTPFENPDSYKKQKEATIRFYNA